ncbi:replicative DNA helicase [Paenibacillus hodogayensis]|uniref:Replicative DNA helicase n=1 Tax=Paenibacillus hodogayensis TaxID=279208 RepID=A0ABV5VV62_9BACL
MESLEAFDLKHVLAGFQGRMAKIALFDPLFELQRKKQTDSDGADVDMMEMGLLTLLFFFEQKLMRNTRAGVKQLARFLLQTTEGRLRLGPDAAEELARSVVQTFRPASGKKRSFSFYNWETGRDDTVFTSLLKASSFDAKTNTQYYALDEDGLELVFATKEFYMEFQLSIHQLLLRKQLEKGEFQGALRQINEMRVDVESLQERMLKLEHEIKRSIVSEETLKRYGSLLDDIYVRLHRENEEFEELRQFVKETRERLLADSLKPTPHNAYEYILRIAGELEKVHGEHTGLLQRSMELKNQALHAAKESLYYTGMASFNFEQDIAGLLIGSPLPLEALKGVVAPFLGLGRNRGWSPLTVFAEQNISRDGEGEEPEEAFPDVAGKEPTDGFVRKRGRLFRRLMGDLLERLERTGSVELKDMIDGYADAAAMAPEGDNGPYMQMALLDEETIGEADRSSADESPDRGSLPDEAVEAPRDAPPRRLLDSRAFYDFWLILHQRSPVGAAAEQREDNGPSGMEEALRLLGERSLVVEERPGVIRASGRFHIQNMTVTWGGTDNGIR